MKSITPIVCRITPFIRNGDTLALPFVSSLLPFIVRRHSCHGFSLTELVIALAIAGVLLAIGIPGMGRMADNNRLATTANTLIADIALARSEAIKRGGSAGLCKSSNGTTCTTTGGWDQGWLVFVDTDNSGTWSQTSGQEDEILRAREPVPTGMTAAGTVLNGAANIDLFLFNRRGAIPAISSNQAISYTLCSTKTGKGRNIAVIPTGRPTFTEISC